MTFTHIVSAFFTTYLASERGLAANTIASYSDVMKRLLIFASERCCRQELAGPRRHEDHQRLPGSQYQTKARCSRQSPAPIRR